MIPRVQKSYMSVYTYHICSPTIITTLTLHEGLYISSLVQSHICQHTIIIYVRLQLLGFWRVRTSHRPYPRYIRYIYQVSFAEIQCAPTIITYVRLQL